jgi:hypothetical protein
MRPGALKCVKCGSFQAPWRRTLSAPHLGIAIAVIAATSVWWEPALKDLQTPKGTILKTSFGGAYGPALSVSVTNVGTMPGVVQAMAFATGGTEQVTSWPLLIQTSPLVVEPGKTLLVMGTLPIGSMTPPYPEPTTKCAMEIFFTGTDNETKAHRDLV